MFRNWLSSSQNNEVAYQPIPAEVEQDNTDLFNQIPADVLVMIASKLSNQDIISFFLANKKTFHLFEDFKGNSRHSQLRVFMTTSNRSDYQGEVAEINFCDVNHVVMAQYFMRINMDELDANKDEMEMQEAKSDCMIAATSISLGISIGIAVHVGGAILLDKVILPACFQNCVHVPFGGSCECGGNICLATDPTVVGIYPVNMTATVSLTRYICMNVTCCYIPVPLIASYPIGYGVGSFIDCCYENLRGETYHEKRNTIERQLRMLDSSRKNDFRSIIVLNDQLRERKIGGFVYRMFQPPITINMSDDEPQNINNVNNAPQVPQRISME